MGTHKLLDGFAKIIALSPKFFWEIAPPPSSKLSMVLNKKWEAVEVNKLC